MAKTGVIMGVKGFVPTPHAPKTKIGNSAAIRPTIVELGWDKLGTMDNHWGLVPRLIEEMLGGFYKVRTQ